MRAGTGRGLLVALACAGALACAAQTDTSEQAMRDARTTLTDIARLARAKAPPEQFDAALAQLRVALRPLADPAPEEGATRTVTSAPPQQTGTATAPPPRPSPEELDRRQRELEGQLRAQPPPEASAWREQLAAELAALEKRLAAAPLDHDAIRAAAVRLDNTIAERPPPPDAP